MYYPLASREKADACVKKWRRIQHLEQCFSAGVYLRLRFPGAARCASIASKQSLSGSKRLLAWEFIVSSKASRSAYMGSKSLAQVSSASSNVGTSDRTARQLPVIRILRDPEMENPG